MNKRALSLLIAASLSGLIFIACNNDANTTTSTDSTTIDSTSSGMSDTSSKMSEEEGVMVGGAKMVPSKNIVENAVNSSDHTTLVAAVTQAGLVETLSSAGPFTVFAPTNEAFNKLPAGTVETLLKPESKKDLTDVLTYHVVSGAYKAADLKDGQKLKTVEGKELTVGVKDGAVTINGANVTIADVVSSNGVTHVVDAVLLPKK